VTALVESPVHGNGHAGFGGRPAETDRWQHRHRAAGRPHTFRLASMRDWDALKRDVAPIYTAPNAAAARVTLEDLTERWGTKYAAIIRLWENAWNEFIPFLDYTTSRFARSSARQMRSSR
jgi:transposase-like protein